jgi:hypothetical protein
MEQTQEKIVDPQTDMFKESPFIKFEKDVRQYLVITNWRTVQETKTFIDSAKPNAQPESKVVTEFRADVLQQGTSSQLLNVLLPPKKLQLSNKTFREKINEYTKDKDPKSQLRVSLKKFGEALKTTYDVEVF